MQGRTPVIVVSGRAFNERVGTLVALPVTEDPAQEDNPFVVPVGSKRLGQGHVLCHQPRSIDWRADDVAQHPWRRMDPVALEAVLFKLNEVISAD